MESSEDKETNPKHDTVEFGEVPAETRPPVMVQKNSKGTLLPPRRQESLPREQPVQLIPLYSCQRQLTRDQAAGRHRQDWELGRQRQGTEGRGGGEDNAG